VIKLPNDCDKQSPLIGANGNVGPSRRWEAMTRQSPKRIYVLEKEPQLETMLQAELTAGEASIRGFSTPEDCREALLTKPCDLLIVDVKGGGPTELYVLQQAKRTAPGIASLAVVERAAVRCAVEAIKAGADDCLDKPVEPEQLRAAVERQLARVDGSPPGHTRALTPMEIQVLQLILAGKTSHEMAAELHRSKRTIDVHRAKIMRRFQATNLVALIERALAAGFSDQAKTAPPIPIRSVGQASREGRTRAAPDHLRPRTGSPPTADRSS